MISKRSVKAIFLGSAEGLGVMNSVDEHFAPNAAIKKLFCVPPGLASNDLTDVVKKYLKENPQDRGQPARETLNKVHHPMV